MTISQYTISQCIATNTSVSTPYPSILHADTISTQDYTVSHPRPFPHVSHILPTRQAVSPLRPTTLPSVPTTPSSPQSISSRFRCRHAGHSSSHRHPGTWPRRYGSSSRLERGATTSMSRELSAPGAPRSVAGPPPQLPVWFATAGRSCWKGNPIRSTVCSVEPSSSQMGGL